MSGKLLTRTGGIVRLLMLLALVGCAHPHTVTQPDALDTGHLTEAPQLAPGPVLPAETWVDPELISERRGSVTELQFSVAGADYIDSGGAVAALDTQRVRIADVGAAGGWAMFRFADLLPTDAPHTLRIEADSAQSSGEMHIGISNYATNRWDWYTTAPNANNVIPLQPEQNVISPAGNSYLVVMAAEDSDLAISRLVIYLEDGLPPPTNVKASQGTKLGWIEVTSDPPLLGTALTFRGLSPNGPFWPSGTPPEELLEELQSLPKGTPYYFRRAATLDGQIGRMSEPVLGFAGYIPEAYLDGEITHTDGNLITVRFDPQRSILNDPRSNFLIEYRFSNGAVITTQKMDPVYAQFELDKGQAWADMQVINAGGWMSIFGGVWASCPPEGGDLYDDPNSPDPHATVNYPESGWVTVDLGFVIDFGTAPYTVQLQTDWHGEFEASPFGTIVYAGKADTAGPVLLSDVELPAQLSEHEYIFAVRVYDANEESREFAWCTPVVLDRP